MGPGARELDVLPLFDDDLGVQLLATCTGSSAFRSGVAELLADAGGHRAPSTLPPVFGLAPEWLLADGVPLADALALAHPEQFDRLAAACPEALPTAVLAGDPCFGRMLAARPYRDRFRRALGVGRGQRLVLLNSTWSPQSLLGDGDNDGDDSLPAPLPPPPLGTPR
ncbi:hypothetical protein ACFVS7_23960 [Streptomyces rubiginosohelvolus]|uniref:hypothetical protein n=1 Tax=Streptomyces rubiginosohelvolus TaxID=67362 RepID=UPI0036D874B4